MPRIWKLLSKFGCSLLIGAGGGLIGLCIGAKLFPNHNDLGDITQGFFQLGAGALGFIVGIVAGIVLYNLLFDRQHSPSTKRPG